MTACRQSEPHGSAASSSTAIDSLAFDTVFRLVKQVRLESTSGEPIGVALLGDVLDDGRILLADPSMSNVKLFAPNGHLLRTIGRKGRGPGELIAPVHVAYASQAFELYVTDIAQRRILRFGGTEFEFDTMITLSNGMTATRLAYPLDSSRLLVAGAIANPISDTLLAYLLDLHTGEVLDSLLPLPSSFRGRPYVDREIHALVDGSGDETFLAAQGGRTIYRLTNSTGLIDSMTLPPDAYEGFALPEHPFATEAEFRDYRKLYPMSTNLAILDNSTLVLEVMAYDTEIGKFTRSYLIIPWTSEGHLVLASGCRCRMLGAVGNRVAFILGDNPDSLIVEWRHLSLP